MVGVKIPPLIAASKHGQLSKEKRDSKATSLLLFVEICLFFFMGFPSLPQLCAPPPCTLFRTGAAIEGEMDC